MDRRVFLVLLLAGCADPSPDILPAVRPSPNPTPQRPKPVNPPTASGDAAFDAWAADFYTRAVQSGLPADLLDRELKGLTPDPKVISLDGRQPEFSKPVSAYLQGVVTEGRLAQGRTYRAALSYLPGLEQRFAVPREIMLALWAMETAFGATLGDFDVIRSMATRGSLGGLATSTREVCDVLDGYGMDVILLETVGVGQSELDISRAADTTLVVLVPESGDSIQTLKAGEVSKDQSHHAAPVRAYRCGFASIDVLTSKRSALWPFIEAGG